MGVLQSCRTAQLVTTKSKGFWSDSSWQGEKLRGGYIHLQWSIKPVLPLGRIYPLFLTAIPTEFGASRGLQEARKYRPPLPLPPWLHPTPSKVGYRGVLRDASFICVLLEGSSIISVA